MFKVSSFWGLWKNGRSLDFGIIFIFYNFNLGLSKRIWQKLFNLTILRECYRRFMVLARKQTLIFVGSGGRNRIFGTIGNPALFAGYELFSVFLALMMYLDPDTTKNSRYFT